MNLNVLGFLTNRRRTVGELVTAMNQRQSRDAETIDMLRAEVENLERIGAGLRDELRRVEMNLFQVEECGNRSFQAFMGSFYQWVNDRNRVRALVGERNRLAAELHRERVHVQKLEAVVKDLRGMLEVAELQVAEVIGGDGVTVGWNGDAGSALEWELAARGAV